MKYLINDYFPALLIIALILIVFTSCNTPAGASFMQSDPDVESSIVVGADRTELYFPLIKGKKVAIVGNHSSIIGKTHLVDSLLSTGFNIQKVFSPEHGFRGQAAAGEHIDSGTDIKTGLPIISLYGSNRHPTPAQLEGLDIILFDIQDVGARFYTYISTMTLIMREAARMNIPMIILDRPNPNGHFVDGPILEPEFGSFVGMHPIPVVHGMTIGEYAQMVNGEKWLGEGLVCDITIIPVDNYSHLLFYKLSVPPSPNLPNMNSIYLYPSLCFFEGSQVSIGRGTEKPFQVYGHSSFNSDNFDYSFVPQSNRAAPNPPEMDKLCFGHDLSTISLDSLQQLGRIELGFLINAYRQFPEKEHFFNKYFDLLAGNRLLRSQIMAGLTQEQIRLSWQKDIEEFKKIRSKYLLYPDFE